VSATITGVGLVTPLGRSTNQTWRAILAGEHITTHTRLDIECPTRFGDGPEGPAHVAQSRQKSPALRAVAKPGSEFRDVPRVITVAIDAVNEAITQAGWTDCRDTAVIACTSKGSVENWMSDAAPSTDFGLSDLSSAIADHIGSNDGPRLTLSAACASGLHGLIRGAMMIESGEARRVLVAAAEASVHPLFLASFKRLGVLAGEGELCRPFDINRGGFLMSEAAAAVCLESEPEGHGIVTIDRCAMGGDATHLTGSDPDGRVLRHLLGRVIDGRPLDLVHAHGTGTVSNDATELAAFEASLPQNSRPTLYSHKAALGHSLGASGLVAVVLNCLAHQAGVVPGNINTQSPMRCKIFDVDRVPIKRPIRRSIVHAAGFGGPMAVVGLISDTTRANRRFLRHRRR
jgi:3-oxoacyl-[acyl-carrier-protein] synthase II